MKKIEAMSEGDKVPKVRIMPPVIYLAFLILGLILHYFIPVGLFSSRGFAQAIGWILIVLGAALLAWAVKTFARSGIDPAFKPVPRLATEGPYKFSRNPIYIAFTAVYLGLSFVFNTFWPVALLAFVLAVLHYRVILYEEEYLEELFADEYGKYRSRVRRWF